MPMSPLVASFGLSWRTRTAATSWRWPRCSTRKCATSGLVLVSPCMLTVLVLSGWHCSSTTWAGLSTWRVCASSFWPALLASGRPGSPLSTRWTARSGSPAGLLMLSSARTCGRWRTASRSSLRTAAATQRWRTLHRPPQRPLQRLLGCQLSPVQVVTLRLAFGSSRRSCAPWASPTRRAPAASPAAPAGRAAPWTTSEPPAPSVVRSPPLSRAHVRARTARRPGSGCSTRAAAST